MKFLFPFFTLILIGFTTIAQIDPAEFKTKRTIALGIDTILDNRSKQLFEQTWKVSRIAPQSSYSDKTLLADSGNFITARTMLLDKGGKSRPTLALIRGGVDTSKVKLRPDGYFQLNDPEAILISQWVNSDYLESYSGVLYYQALYTRLRIATVDPGELYFKKHLSKSLRRNGIDKVYVRGSQLVDGINSPSGIEDLSNGLAEHWKRDVVEKQIRDRNPRVGFIDVITTNEGGKFQKNVQVIGVNGLIYETKYSSDDLSVKLTKQEFKELMQELIENQPKK